MKALSSLVIVILSGLSFHLHAETIRDYYDEPGINPFKTIPDEEFSEFVDTFSGMLLVSITDLYLPGNGGFDIAVKRSYATSYLGNVELTPYGYGWSMHFGRIVVPDGHASKVCSQYNWATSVVDNPSIELPDGSRKLLVMADYHSTYLVTKDWWSAECVAGDIVVRSPDGTAYHMTYHTSINGITSIYATHIEDANGNSMSISYNVNPSGITYIDEVTTSDGRAVSFSYADENNSGIRLSSVEANNQTWNYDYTFSSGTIIAHPQLSKIERPDNTEWEFSYNPIFSDGTAGSLALNSITTPMGGTTSYNYGWVHFSPPPDERSVVVTSKSTSGTDVTPGTWNYSYTPAYNSQSGYDETVVVGPDNIRMDYHVGYSSVWSGNVWRTGLKEFEDLYDTQGNLVERLQYSYAALLLSNENFWHGRDTLRIDSATYLPVLQEVLHYREGRSVTTTYSNFTAYGQAQQVVETTTIVGFSDRVTTYSYANNPSAWILGLITTESLSLPTQAPIGNWVIERQFDGSGNMLVENRYGVTTTYTYTSEGDIASITDDANNTTTFQDYFRGIAREENQPEGITITRAVNGTGTLAAVTDGRGFTTTYDWDSLNRLVEIDYPVNDDVTISYGTNERTLTRGDFKETMTWDGFGRELNMTRRDSSAQLSIAIKRTRDSLGRVSFESYPNNSISGVTFSYDAAGRKLSERHSNGNEVNYTYPTSTEVVIEDENGNVTEKMFYHYGSLHDDTAMLRQVNSPENVITLYARDGLGQLWEAFQGSPSDGQIWGHARVFNRNAKNFLVSEEHPETGVTTYTHDAVGNVISKTMGGITETFQYDDRYRLVSKAYSDATPTVSYAYDADDNLISVSSSAAYRGYSYDENGNLIGEELHLGSSEYALTYNVNSLDFVNSIVYPSGRTVTFSPDALGRPSSAMPYVTDVEYHPSGFPESVTLANGVVTTSTLDTRMRPVSLNAATATTNVVDLSFGYDNSLNILSITDNVGSIHDHALSYDGLDRLVSASGPWGSELIEYEPNGNIYARNRNGTVQDYYYNNMKLDIRAFPGYYMVVTHDSRGNLTSDGPNVYSYNADNKLISATTATETINYAYDGQGTRVSRTDSGGNLHYFYSANGLLMGEYNPAGGFDEYVYVNRNLAARIHDDTTIVGTP